MAAPVIGTRSRFPARGTTVDRTHPLAAGLEFCFIPSASGSDLAKGYGSTRAVASYTPYQTAYGPGIQTNGTAAIYTFAGVPDAPFLGPMSVLWAGRSLVAAGTYGNIAMKRTTTPSGNTAVPLWAYITVDATRRFRVARYGATQIATYDVFPTGGVSQNRDSIAVLSMPATTTATGALSYMDSPSTNSPGSSGNVAVTGNNEAMTVGARTYDGLNSDVVTNIFAVWSRQLNAAEARMLTADPYCFLKV